MIFEEILLAQDHAAQRAALAVDIFGRRMHHDVGAELERPLQARRREGIVDHKPRAPFVRDGGDGFQVDDGERRVRRRLQEQHLGFGAHRLRPLIDVAAIDQRAGDAEARQDFLDDVPAGAEHRLGGDDVVAHAQAGQEGRGDRRHAAGGRASHGSAFQRRHALLEHGHGGIAETAILIAVDLAFEAGFGLFRRLIGEAGGQEQRLGRLLERRAQRPCPHSQRAGAHFPGFLFVAMQFCCALGIAGQVSYGRAASRTAMSDMKAISHHTALIYVMVIVSAADGSMSERSSRSSAS